MNEETTELALLIWRHALLTRAQSDAQEVAISAILTAVSQNQPALAAVIRDQIAERARTAPRQPPQEPEEILAQQHTARTLADYQALLTPAAKRHH